MTILAIDAGTTGVTALLVSADARVVARGYSEFPQHFPADGWVEHDPNEIWTATLSALDEVLKSEAVTEHGAPTAVGITNQRETVVLWDRETLGAARMAIVWQDRRTAGYCDQLKADGHEARVSELTGLRLDPYFSGSKLAWIRKQEPNVWAGVTEGRTAIGTVDSYLIARMTRGVSHITDASNACRTLLFDISTGEWSQELCDLFGVPVEALPEVVPSYGVVATTDPSAFAGLELPIAGIAGDQQAALFGQAGFATGSSKCTYGTGSFVLVNTADTIVRSDAGLLSTVAWKHPDGTLTYALEGAIFVTGAAVQWLRDGLQIIESASETEELANSVPNSAGVVFVPALTGLGAPDWDPNARGAIFGLTRGATKAHIVRATLEAIAFEVRDVVDVMTNEADIELPRLTVDGGAAANNFLCQIQANQVRVPVVRSEILETTGLGAAFLAGLGTGLWANQEELAATWRSDATFAPQPRDEHAHRRWRVAVERTKGWATAVST
ncbi:MAG: glycerol kinase GlpK [Candidatus Nanopelagicales bacterium]|nr:glycerol kinase GlpK [Candidatus Nanopelagicales bacterium]